MNLILILLLLSACSSPYEEKEAKYTVSAAIYDSFKLSSNKEGMPEINIPTAPVENLHKRLLKDHPTAQFLSEDLKLQVLTPEEYKFLRKYLSKSEIDSFAQSYFLQNSRFNVLCIGMEEGESEEEKEFFILTKSPDVTRFRIALNEIFVTRGGRSDRFYPTIFQPYIPLAATKKNLRLSSKKNNNDCISSLEASEPY